MKCANCSIIILLHRIESLQPECNQLNWDVNEDMERRGLLDFLLGKHLLHTRRSFDDALFDLDIELCNETR